MKLSCESSTDMMIVPTGIIVKIKDASEPEACPICLEPLINMDSTDSGNKSSMEIINCPYSGYKHFFHFACILESFKENNNTCCICKNDLEEYIHKHIQTILPGVIEGDQKEILFLYFDSKDEEYCDNSFKNFSFTVEQYEELLRESYSSYSNYLNGLQNFLIKSGFIKNNEILNKVTFNHYGGAFLQRQLTQKYTREVILSLGENGVVELLRAILILPVSDYTIEDCFKYIYLHIDQFWFTKENKYIIIYHIVMRKLSLLFDSFGFEESKFRNTLTTAQIAKIITDYLKNNFGDPDGLKRFILYFTKGNKFTNKDVSEILSAFIVKASIAERSAFKIDGRISYIAEDFISCITAETMTENELLKLVRLYSVNICEIVTNFTQFVSDYVEIHSNSSISLILPLVLRYSKPEILTKFKGTHFRFDTFKPAIQHVFKNIDLRILYNIQSTHTVDISDYEQIGTVDRILQFFIDDPRLTPELFLLMLKESESHTFYVSLNYILAFVRKSMYEELRKAGLLMDVVKICENLERLEYILYFIEYIEDDEYLYKFNINIDLITKRSELNHKIALYDDRFCKYDSRCPFFFENMTKVFKFIDRSEIKEFIEQMSKSVLFSVYVTASDICNMHDSIFAILEYKVYLECVVLLLKNVYPESVEEALIYQIALLNKNIFQKEYDTSDQFGAKGYLESVLESKAKSYIWGCAGECKPIISANVYKKFLRKHNRENMIIWFEYLISYRRV